MDDEELGPFATLYEEWTGAYPDPRDPMLEERLAGIYREAWATGDSLERVYVLFFIMKRESYFQDRDLILEGLASEDFHVAHTASPIAGVATHLKGVDLGPELVDIYRGAALRHPMLDLSRGPNLRRPGDGWPEGRPFLQLYEQWMSDDVPRDEKLEGQLAALNQHTWESGDSVDRAFVLKFLSYHREPRAEWILEGIQSEHYGLAYVALFEAGILVREGYDFGPDLLRLVDEHEQRFPDMAQTIAISIRLDLKDRAKSTKP